MPNLEVSLIRQYKAALDMFKQPVEACPEPLWLDESFANRFWHIAYHAVFYTHLYLHPSLEGFRPWPGHREGAQDLAKPLSPPYTKAEIGEYLAVCESELEESVRMVDLDAPSGFHWLACDRFETHLYNMRHLQHHAGQLMDRLRTSGHTGNKWNRGF
jgi:hypothetical protein